MKMLWNVYKQIQHSSHTIKQENIETLRYHNKWTFLFQLGDHKESHNKK